MFQSDAASAHWRSSLVSDKHVPACRFQSVSPGAYALVWFSSSHGWKWMVHITVMSCCSNSCCQRSVKLLATFACSAPRVSKNTELLRHKTSDFTPDVASQQTRPQFCRLQITDSHSAMRLSETVRDVKHRWAVVVNRMTFYIQQGRVETPVRWVGQLCCSSVANLLQYLFANNYQNTMSFDKVIAKIKGAISLLHSVVLRYLFVSLNTNSYRQSFSIWYCLHDYSLVTMLVTGYRHRWFCRISLFIFTARRVCIARTMPWQGVCPSVRPSHAGILSKRLNISLIFFHRRVGIRTILVFPYQTG